MNRNRKMAIQLLLKTVVQLPVKKESSKQDIVQLIVGVVNQIIEESLPFGKKHPEASEVLRM